MAPVSHFCFLKMKECPNVRLQFHAGKSSQLLQKTAEMNPPGIKFSFFSFRKAPTEEHFFQSIQMANLFLYFIAFYNTTRFKISSRVL